MESNICECGHNKNKHNFGDNIGLATFCSECNCRAFDPLSHAMGKAIADTEQRQIEYMLAEKARKQ